MGRRSKGEGTIYYDERKEIWIYQISYQDENDIRQRKKFKAKVKREAMRKGKAFLEEIHQGLKPNGGKMTVEQWIGEWLPTYVRPRIRPRTFEKYKSCMDTYILPPFGDVPLEELTALDVQKHLNSLLENGRKDGKGLSSSTVRAVRRYFCMCLDDAVDNGLITRNVVRSTKPAKLIKKDIVVLTKDELNRLIAIAREISHPYMRVMMPELIRFTAHTGLRQGEVFALRWQDVDFEQGAIFVQHSLAHVVGRGAVMQAPKTKNSRRRVLLLAEDVDFLRKYRDWQQAYADELGDKYARRDLVFASTFGSPISPTNFLRRHFHPLLKKCGIKEGFTFHGLRHTHATLLLKQGVNPKIVQERLGHSSIKVTMDTYSHVLPDMQQQAVNALSKILT